MYGAINKSNLHDVFYSAYEELGQFGTACFLILEDFEMIIRARSFTAGEYFLGIGPNGKPNAFAREFEMTVGQLISEFGKKIVLTMLSVSSSRIRSMSRLRFVILSRRTKPATR